MKKCLLITLFLLLVSCSSPSEFSIQTAIAKTENVNVSNAMIQTAIAKTQTAGGLEVNSLSNCSINSPLKNEWKTVVCETFDNNNRNYWLGEKADYGTKIEIRDGKYYIDQTSKNTRAYIGGWSTTLQIGSAKDYVISVTGKITSKYKQCAWGINVRGNNQDGYTFLIDNQGNYWLTAEGIANNYLGNIKYGSNSAIKWDIQNIITALVEGNEITFYVNGKLITSYKTDNSSRTEISWSVYGSEGVTALFEFDNLLIKEK